MGQVNLHIDGSESAMGNTTAHSAGNSESSVLQNRNMLVRIITAAGLKRTRGRPESFS